MQPLRLAALAAAVLASAASATTISSDARPPEASMRTTRALHLAGVTADEERAVPLLRPSTPPADMPPKGRAAVRPATQAPLAASPPEPAPGPPEPVAEHLRVGEAALSSIPYPWEELGFEVRFLAGRPGYLGMTYVRERRIDVYIRPGQTVAEVRTTVAHELGHAVDVTWLSEAGRATYRQVRGIGGDVPWYGCDGCSDYATPAGDFAETFSYWLTRGTFRSRLAPTPNDEQLDALAELFTNPGR